MADTRVVSLPYRETMGASHLKGWGLGILGLCMLSMGTGGLLLLNAGVAADARSVFRSGSWTMVAGGVTFITISVRLALVRPLYRRRLRRRPAEPWMADHEWNRRGDHVRPGATLVYGILYVAPVLTFLAALCNPLTGELLSEAAPAWSLLRWVLTGLLLLSLGKSAVTAARWWRYRGAWVRFRRFPYFLGETVDVDLGYGGPWSRFDHVTATLRFVRVVHVETADGRMGVSEQHWAQTVSFDRAQGDVLTVSIPVPEDGADTSLSGQPARYWELEIKGETTGLDLEHRFLIPVYARNR